MPVVVRSFAKINIGLSIGPLRDDKFHELRTIYQTLALHDLIRVEAFRGTGIEIVCKDSRVPTDERNTCWRITERTLKALKVRKKIRITIQKNLPVQGGMGGGSSNAVATMLALEKALKRKLTPEERLRIAAEVGSDLPLFLIGGTILGVGRGEQVYALEDLPGIQCVTATPAIGVSTPAAFADWDKKQQTSGKLTLPGGSATMNSLGHSVYAWLSGSRFTATGVPAKARDRAEALLLDLVRTGIENDFESVVFPKYPEIRKVKRVLERSGAAYASLSGSGATVYGLFDRKEAVAKAVAALKGAGVPAQATATLNRTQYWKMLFPSERTRKAGSRF
jgi:4-diphosphocytidyl-2-C-methyl-D-erythritol kinase